MAAAPHPLVLRCSRSSGARRHQAAEEAAEERLKTAGRDINALELRSQIQQHRGQFGQAARTLDTVIGIDRRADWAYNELIQLFMTHGKADRRRKGRTRGAPRQSRQRPGHNLFGTILSEMNDLPCRGMAFPARPGAGRSAGAVSHESRPQPHETGADGGSRSGILQGA